jgi:hypothetical protein
VIVTDLNRDNKADVAVLAAGNSNGLLVYLGNGDGTLQAPSSFLTGTTPVNLAAADLNADGNMDVVVVNQGANTVAVLLGNGTGVVGSPAAFGVGPTARGVTTGDVNGDGNLDVVVTNQGSGSLSVLLGTGTGSLQAAVNVTTGTSSIDSALVDLNGDGRLDIVTSLNALYNGIYSIAVRIGNNSTAPGAPTYYMVGAQPWSLATGDVNGDSRQDVVVANNGDGTLSVLLGNGDGTLQAPLSVASGIFNPAAVLLRDIDGDGRLDALVGGLNGYARSIPLLLNSGCSIAGSVAASNSNSLFSYSVGSVDVSGSAELTPSNSDSATSAFAAAALAGAAWDPNALQLRLGNSGNCNALLTNCAALHPSWTPRYANLIGYWPLDGSGSIAAAGALSATVGPSLTVSGASVSYQTGHLSQAIGLAASSNAYLALPASTPNTLAVTAMAWVNAASAISTARLFDFGTDANTYMMLAPLAYTANGNAAMLFETSLAGTKTSLYAPFSMSTNQWHHVAASLNGNVATLYVDGGLVGSIVNSVTASQVAGANNAFGKGQSASIPYFVGAFDELALFNVALNGNDVSAIYGRQSAFYAGSVVSRVLGPQSTTPTWSDLAWATTLPTNKALPSGGVSESPTIYPGLPTSNLSLGQLLLWHLDENSAATAPGGLDARDDSGQGNHGKSYGGVSFGQAGMLGGSYAFDGNLATLSSSYAIANPTPFTGSIWFNTQSVVGGKLLGFGTAANANSANSDRQIYINNANRISFVVTPNSSAGIYYGSAVNDGRWHHAAATLGPSGMTLFIDGKQVPSAGTPAGFAGTGYWRVGGDYVGGFGDSPSSNYVQGRIDEVAIFGRVLSPAEIKALWRRGANRLKWQVRSCTSMTCADNPSWLGPDGSISTYFSELNNLSASGNVLVGCPDLLFSNFAPSLVVPNNAYLQYRMILESDDINSLCTYNGAAAACSPEILSARVGPSVYPTAGTLTSTAGTSLHAVSSLTPLLGPGGCPAGVTFTLSNNGGTTWYWYNGYLWTNANGTAAQSNSAATLTGPVLGRFLAQRGAGVVTYRAFLSSTGATPCSLAGVSLVGVP